MFLKLLNRRGLLLYNSKQSLTKLMFCLCAGTGLHCPERSSKDTYRGESLNLFILHPIIFQKNRMQGMLWNFRYQSEPRHRNSRKNSAILHSKHIGSVLCVVHFWLAYLKLLYIHSPAKPEIRSLLPEIGNGPNNRKNSRSSKSHKIREKINIDSLMIRSKSIKVFC